MAARPRDTTDPTLAGLGSATRDATWEILSERLNDLVIMADVSATIFYASPACRRLGYSQAEMVGRGPADFVHPDDLAHFAANTRVLFEEGAPPPAPADREHRVRRKDGSWVWLEGSPSLITDAEGQPIGVINVFRDVTERRAIREALEESERRYRLLAENSTDMISQTCVATGRITYLSPSVERVTGYAPEELIGQRMQDFVHPEDKAPFLAAFVDLLKGERACGEPIRFRGRTKAGDWIWLESNPRVVLGADGKPCDIIDITRDVHLQEALEHRLRDAVAEAEKLATVKSDFLANMSHEIRTPLTAMLGFTGLLAERADLPAQAQTYVARVASAGRSLLALVNDVLDFSKLEAGKVSLAPQPTPIAALVGEAVELFESGAAAKGLELSFTAAETTPGAVRVDPERVRQVLVNLIGNAVKFTDRGAVRVRLDYDAAAERLAIEVADTGPGISAQARAKLFERFTQADGSSTRAKGGTGLGLAISQRLAHAMGGAVTLKSRIGRGSTFRFELPAPPAQALAAAAGGEAALGLDLLDGVRVLVADDNPANRELARAILAPAGVEVSEARDGLEAAEAAARLPVDVILMDMRMPGLDGLQAAWAIRHEPGPNQDIPILVFSADGELAAGAGPLGPFNGRVSKPMTPQALLAAVAEAVCGDLQPLDQELRHDHG